MSQSMKVRESQSEIDLVIDMLAHSVGSRTRRGLPFLFEGDPGRGKTTVLEDGLRERGFYVKTFLLSQHDPTDINGIPYITNGVARFAPLDWMVEANEAKYSVILLDELTTVEERMQAPALTLLTHGRAGSYQFGPNVFFVGLCNPVDSAAGGYPLSPPMANRFIHFQFPSLPYQSFVDYMDTRPTWFESEETPVDPTQQKISTSNPSLVEEMDVKVKPLWEKYWGESKAVVSGFLASAAGVTVLNVLPKKGSKDREKAWPSSRTWEFFMRARTACRVFDAPSDLSYRVLTGCVGRGPTDAFLEWEAQANLPTPQDVFQGKWKPNPRRPDISYAVVSGCNSAILQYVRDDKQGKELSQGYWKVLKDLIEAGHGEMVYNASKLMLDRNFTPKDVALQTFVFSKQYVRRQALEGRR